MESARELETALTKGKLIFLKMWCPHTVDRIQSFIKAAEQVRAVFLCGMIHWVSKINGASLFQDGLIQMLFDEIISI